MLVWVVVDRKSIPIMNTEYKNGIHPELRCQFITHNYLLLGAIYFSQSTHQHGNQRTWRKTMRRTSKPWHRQNPSSGLNWRLWSCDVLPTAPLLWKQRLKIINTPIFYLVPSKVLQFFPRTQIPLLPGDSWG